MSRLISLIVLLTLLVAGQAHAYTRARVYVHAKFDGDGIEGATLQQTLVTSLMSKLVKHYSCFDMMDSSGMDQMVGFIRQQQLVGVADDKVELSMDNVAGQMDMKYLIIVNITANKEMSFYSINIVAKNKKKAGFPFYTEAETFRSYNAAIGAVDRSVEDLIKGFTKYLSDEREEAGGEICAVKGPVTVTVETERTHEPPDETYYKHCNGDDRLWKKSVYERKTGKETWKLERIGIPDTRGTMEGSFYEESRIEEFDGCHQCPLSTRAGNWHYSKKSEETGSITGLSEITGADKFPTKDATIRLHFYEGGTYDISVAASSAKGKRTSSAEVSAEGECDVSHKKWPNLTNSYTRHFEYTFTGFSGTPYDTTLKGKKTLKFENQETGEVTTMTIDFDLSRPTVSN